MQNPYSSFSGYEYANGPNPTISINHSQLYSQNQVYVDSSLYGYDYNYYDSSAITTNAGSHPTHLDDSPSSTSCSSHTMIGDSGYYTEQEMYYATNPLLSTVPTPFVATVTTAATGTPYLIPTNSYNNSGSSSSNMAYYSHTKTLQTPTSVLPSYPSLVNVAISNTNNVNHAKSEIKIITPIINPSFIIPSQNAYTNGMNRTEYEIEAYIAKYQYKILTQQSLLYTLRKIMGVWYSNSNKPSNKFFYNNHNNHNNCNDNNNDFIPDVIIQEIVSFIEENNMPFVDMNVVQHISCKNIFGYEDHEQSLGQLILRNGRNLGRIYSSNKKSNKWIGEEYDSGIASGSLFPTWESWKTDGQIRYLWYDCMGSVQINGIFIFRAGKVMENAKYINIYIADDFFNTMQEHCRLLVENLDGWVCFTDLNIKCRYIKLVFDDTRASVDQLLFI